MELQFTDLSEHAFLLINGPLVFLNLAVNIFFACCLIFPLYGRRTLKQPLKILLGFLVCFSIVYFVSLPLLYGVFKEVESFEVIIVLWIIFLYNVHNSMTCSIWLNFYYYIQIVPSQQALLIWVKRNIKSVIYMALLFDGTIFLICGAVIVANNIFQTTREFNDINVTRTEHQIESLFFTSQVCFFFAQVHTLIYLCIMMLSSFSTVHFLHSHIRSVTQNGGFLSTARVQSQVRVTITGISQGVLFLLYGIFFIFSHSLYQHFALSTWVFFTVTSLYISGTTVNLGIGQTAFRQRAADVWKSLKALWGVSMVTNDVKMCSSQLTSGVTPYTVNVQM